MTRSAPAAPDGTITSRCSRTFPLQHAAERAEDPGMERDHIERRIGVRRQIRSVPMAWCRDPANPSPYDAQVRPDGNLVEVSVSGAGLIAVTHPYLQEGTKVLIACLGAVGPVIARRIEPDVYPGESYYGVEFCEPNGRLAQTVYSTFLAKTRDAPDVYLPRD
ncbi:MAG TPA: hypothetical protein VNQ33_02460 [Acidimicrobiales bacterium]|nr:hypothetical protein [Acidimicrobiales bacterium]